MSPSAQARTPWVDTAKGVGIILVVVGHTLRGLDGSGVLPAGWKFVDAWIYAFHMPLFFFLAGLFLEHSTRRPLGAFIDSKARRILWPYFIWSILQECLRHVSGSSDLPLTRLWTIIYKPVMQFWFLYVLFLLLVVYAVWRKGGGSWRTFVILAFFLNISMMLGMNYGPWGVVYQMGIEIPFLALGVWSSAAQWHAGLPGLRPAALWGSAAAGYGIVAMAVALAPSGIPGLPVALAATGIFATVMLSEALRRWSSAALLATLGVLSLEIFVAHTICSAVWRAGLGALHLNAAFLQIGGGILIGLAGPVGLQWLCKKWGLQILFSLPDRRHG